jgi:hypothetical protein
MEGAVNREKVPFLRCEATLGACGFNASLNDMIATDYLTA